MTADARFARRRARFRRPIAWTSAVAVALALTACGEGGSAMTGSVSVLTTAGTTSTPAATTSPVPTATPTATATPTPTSTPTATATPAATLSGVLDEGDSISILWAGNHTGIYAASRPNVTYHGQAVGGSQLQKSGNDLDMRFAADAALHPAYVTVLIGANDMPQVTLAWSIYPTTQAYVDALFAYVARWKATGAKVAVGTILPQCRANTDNTLSNANRAAINTAIRAAVGTKIDAVIDYAADPDMGPDAAACDTKWYSDGLHPTDGTNSYGGGQGRMAKIYTDVLDRLVK